MASHEYTREPDALLVAVDRAVQDLISEGLIKPGVPAGTVVHALFRSLVSNRTKIRESDWINPKEV